MGLRELKETAHAQYSRGRFELCARTYQQILKLVPRDPKMHMRHAEACRRAGDRRQAITSYRMAASLLLEMGCESRARGALKAALELDPKDSVLLADLARLGPSGPLTSPGPATVPAPSLTSLRQAAAPPAPLQLALPPAPAEASPGTAPPPSPEASAREAEHAARPGSEQAVQLRTEVRRLSDRAVAFRLSTRSRWVLFTSSAPIQVRRVDSLPEPPDFTLDITVDENSLH